MTKIDIDNELADRIRHVAEARDGSLDDVVKVALEQFLAREEARRDFHGEAEEAWTRYQSDGRHVPLAAIDVWLDGWGTPSERPAPPCRDSF